MKLPIISHLQALIIRCIQRGDNSSSQLLDAIADSGGTKNPSAFYQVIGRMQESGWIEEQVVPHRGTARDEPRRRYNVTPSGREAFQGARRFYQNEECRRAA